eukprot:UN33541
MISSPYLPNNISCNSLILTTCLQSIFCRYTVFFSALNNCFVSSVSKFSISCNWYISSTNSKQSLNFELYFCKHDNNHKYLLNIVMDCWSHFLWYNLIFNFLHM